MLTRLYSPRHSEEGFTLIELLIVVIIIGILAAIALPIFLNQQKAAADASVQSDVRNTVDNIATWLTNSSNQNKAEANTSAYTTDGGKAVISAGNYVGVAIASDGSYTVCGYSSNGNQYASQTSPYLYTSSSGKFSTGTSCDAAVNSSGTTAAAAGGGTPVTLALSDTANDAYASYANIGTIPLGGTITYTATNTNATLESGEYSFRSNATTGAPYVNRTVWARVTPTTSGTLKVSTCVAGNPSTDTMLGIFNTGGFAQSNFILGNDDASIGVGTSTTYPCAMNSRLSTVAIPATANTTYAIQLAGYTTNTFSNLSVAVTLN